MKANTEPGERARSQINWPLLIALLIAAWFRWASLARMDNMLHYDEAYNGMDIVSLLDHPHLTPFFSNNFGRESGWLYLAAPFVAVLGARPLSLRLLSTMIGVLTVAAVYRLADELFSKATALGAAATLAVLYWHVHISQLALRAILYPLLGVVTLICLLRARATNRCRWWIGGGLALGLMVYTYFAARSWMAYAAITLLFWAIRSKSWRRGAVLACGLAALVALPLGIYTATHPEAALMRADTVGVFALDGIAGNLWAWTRAWFGQGDTIPEFNLQGRPILDPFLGILVLVGLIGAFWAARRRWDMPWLFGLALFAALPSILSQDAPHFLRAVGLTIPIALIVGAGAWTLQHLARRFLPAWSAVALPLLALAASGGIAYCDFHQRWLNEPQTFWFMEEHINRAANWIKAATPEDIPVYFSPFSPGHPVLIFRSRDLAPRRVGTFDMHQCLVVPDRPAVYVALTQYAPDFERTLSDWAEVTVLAQDENGSGGSPRYIILAAAPNPSPLLGEQVQDFVFDGYIHLDNTQSISETAHAGDVVPVQLVLSADHTPDRPYSVFVHLYGDPSPYDGGQIWGYGDQQICVSYPTHFWQPGETIIQNFDLSLLSETPPGDYQIAVGLYESPAGDRLPVAGQENDYVVLAAVHVQ
ncbi:MAG: glycosyltransferase family 39 protein [Anaerolineae bacterium]|nr:glycosyltransferase family 39 protein [Anaerolineae bacterium]